MAKTTQLLFVVSHNLIIPHQLPLTLHTNILNPLHDLAMMPVTIHSLQKPWLRQVVMTDECVNDSP